MKNLTLRVLFALALATSLVMSGPAGAAMPDTADAVVVYERDVFVIVGSTLRHPDATTDAAAPLFNTAGVRLERSTDVPLTWGEWSAATATSRATVIGGDQHPRTDVRLALTGLVPGGLYSIFWGTLGPDSEQPLCPGVERTLPLDAFGPPIAGAPDANSFVVDATGTVDYHGRTDGALLDATQAFFTVVYHPFGTTAYPFPNVGELRTQGDNCRSSFGEDAMRQLVILHSAQ
jgi:hypothetical protein